MRCVIFGATGYIGGRLVPELLRRGHSVRLLVRSPEKLAEVPWRDRVEVRIGDVTDPEAVDGALAGQDVLFYLIHSLNRTDFEEVDRRAADLAADGAGRAGLRRIVYLGGITPDGQRLSRHLRSRAEVGDILLAGPTPTLVLRAGVIIGSGSASFEMLRYLTERLPVMVTPRWARNRIQPIAVRDVLHYLVAAAELPDSVSGAFDIGGPDVLTYVDMMHGYAAVAGLTRRVIVPVPVLTPWLSAQWVNLVTPVPRSIAVPLMESLINDVVCRDAAIDEHIPPPPEGPTGYRRAVELALARIKDLDVPTRWSDAGAPSDPLPTDPEWSGGTVYTDVRELATTADPDRVWAVIEAIGGENGWYSFPLAWSLRGWIDRLAGGVGLRRGRRDPHRLRPGEALDWWRVEHIERPRLLRLRAEMRVPGRAWLELSVAPGAEGGAVYRQRAVFEPHGFAGQLYWRSIAPFHAVIFGGMARNITGTAEHAPVA
ncbi:SDR family oxidoreductase [Nocardia otitidiscaviarum]|uniref:SDR family oxidoreductase n=1 Tax=Nocardia otitidiscaviarum TaxID=1823 RepID=UPI0004A76FEF|nr:SDR family oxidoreductase [Nocardia otitidiscaviarum]MBF6136709.1 SDR family oxidoreductase [Nocardia otitidiscaviarum]MBF6484912.1 SDR family oxidoreductase [Nocardia otitidiscaviarum]